jgi:hypothetical protein
MRLLFLDESGRLDHPGWFGLGGIVISDKHWPAVRERWQSALRTQGWPSAKELKWHGIRTGDVPPAVGDAAYAAIASMPVQIFVVLLDTRRGLAAEPEFFRSPEAAYSTALMFVAERFQMLLQDCDDYGLIVLDSRFREDDLRLRRFFAELTEEGTLYVRFNRIIEGLLLSPSQFSIGLQCADLVVAATTAAERGIGLGSGYLRRLLPRFAVHPATGEVEGVGLKRFPEAVSDRRDRRHLF